MQTSRKSTCTLPLEDLSRFAIPKALDHRRSITPLVNNVKRYYCEISASSRQLGRGTARQRPDGVRRVAEAVIIQFEMSKTATPKAKLARRVRGKSAPMTLSSRRRPSSKAEDRLDGMAAVKALKESTERIPYQKARRDLESLSEK